MHELRHRADRVFDRCIGVDPVLVNVLCDAQTSGGLLIFVSPDRTDALLAALQARGAQCAAVIGEVLERTRHAIRLR